VPVILTSSFFDARQESNKSASSAEKPHILLTDGAESGALSDAGPIFPVPQFRIFRLHFYSRIASNP
jgi:hypothetical protein